jgi:tryptophanyl-tRNA synthetase
MKLGYNGTKMTKPVILTGLRANSDLHIGNYLGALLPIVDMAKARAGDYQINLFVPDLHSFTTPIDHRQLKSQIFQNLKAFVAAGLPLDNPNIYIYRQSYIPAHSELTWILDCFTGFGEMSRMTQFKDKSAKLNEDRISVGLFNYPVLMAADILLYGASYVPVGDDQTQHLEFTRDIAQRLNKQFGPSTSSGSKDELFVVPKPAKAQHIFFGKDQGLRIRDLIDPSKKMSKSDETGKGVIFLTDKPEDVKKKVMSATTDSLGRVAYNYAEQPGIGNLMDILALLSGKTIGQVCKEFVGQEQYGPLKQAVAQAVGDFLKVFQSKLGKVDSKLIEEKLELSEAKMQVQANQTLTRVQKAVGLR